MSFKQPSRLRGGTERERRFSLSLLTMLVGSFAALLVADTVLVEACTNIVVTPGASANGSMIFGYSSDDHKSYGQLFHYPATKDNDPSKDTVDVYEWETGNYLGTIPQAKETYNVVGNCNEYNVCVGETTFGGPLDLLEPHPNSIIDYGSLMYLALQRGKTSREAAQVMTDLAETYGYHSEGESFTIVDPNEAYLLEMISKGHHEVGALWVSCLIPDGTIVVHANHARITTFLNNDNCTYSDDIVDFALQLDLYKESSLPTDYDENEQAEKTSDEVVDGDHSKFSFSDTFSPKQPYELRYTDARVWDVYRAFLANDEERQTFDDMYLGHVMGKEDPKLSRQNLLPIYFVPSQKVTLKDVRVRMSSHYENTPLEYGHDVAAGMFDMPYKPRPNNWLYTPGNGVPPKMYVNERPIATEKTGFNFIAEIKPLKTKKATSSSDNIVASAEKENNQNNIDGVIHPRLQTVMWFATDDCSTAPRIPVFPSSTKVSSHYAGKGSQQGHMVPIMEFDMSKSFWIQNLVSNLAYYRWKDIYPVLQDKLNDVHASFEERVDSIRRDLTERIIREELQDITANSTTAIEMLRWFHHNRHHTHDNDDHRYSDEGTTVDATPLDEDMLKKLEQLDNRMIDELSDFTYNVGNDMHIEWMDFFGYLFVRYRDFVIMEVDPTDKGCGCHSHEIGIEPKWEARIVSERGDHFEVAIDDSTIKQVEEYYEMADEAEAEANAVLATAPSKKEKASEDKTNNGAEGEVTVDLDNESKEYKKMSSSSSLMTKAFATRPLSKSVWSWLGY